MNRPRIPNNVKHLSGTYRADRDKPKARKTVSTAYKRLVRPSTLPEALIPAWETLSRCCRDAGVRLESRDVILMHQASALYSELMENPTRFTSSKHSELRRLCRSLGISEIEPVMEE